MAWKWRQPIGQERRDELRNELACLKEQIRNAEDLDGNRHGKQVKDDDLDRIAIRRALQNLGYLKLRRRVLSQGLNPAFGRAN
jgi:hypothetical protein